MRKITAGRYIAIGMTMCAIFAIPVYCRSASREPSGSSVVIERPYRPANEPFGAEHGRLTLGFQLAYGLENNIPRDISHIDLVMAEPEIGVIAWDSPYSRLPIKRFEIVGEGILGGSFHPGGKVFGSSLLFRLGLQPAGRLVPYFDAGSGPVYTTINAKAPELTGDAQFLSQGGVGFQYFFKPQRALVVEYHYFHMSNGGLEQPNPGFNGGMVTIGFRWLQGLHPAIIGSSDENRVRFPHFW